MTDILTNTGINPHSIKRRFVNLYTCKLHWLEVLYVQYGRVKLNVLFFFKYEQLCCRIRAIPVGLYCLYVEMEVAHYVPVKVAPMLLRLYLLMDGKANGTERVVWPQIHLLSRPRSWPVTAHCCVTFPFSVGPLKSVLIVADFYIVCVLFGDGNIWLFLAPESNRDEEMSSSLGVFIGVFQCGGRQRRVVQFSGNKRVLKIVNSAGYGE